MDSTNYYGIMGFFQPKKAVKAEATDNKTISDRGFHYISVSVDLDM